MPVSINGSGTIGGVSDFSSSNIALTDPEVTGGIYLGGTGSANYLDDYEEGEFSPRYNFGASYSGETFGYYTKVGNVVYIHISIRLNAVTGTPSGDIEITGLPFSISLLFGRFQRSPLTIMSRFWSDPPEAVRADFAGDNLILFKRAYDTGNENFTQGSDVNTSNSNRVLITGFYYTDS